MSDEHRVGSNGASGPLLDVRDHNSRGRSGNLVLLISSSPAYLSETSALKIAVYETRDESWSCNICSVLIPKTPAPFLLFISIFFIF